MATRTLSTAAEELLPRSRTRKSWIIQNEDTTDAIFLKFERAATPTVSSTDHDHRLGPGASLALNRLTDGSEQIEERVTAIAAANTPRVSFFQTEDIIR